MTQSWTPGAVKRLQDRVRRIATTVAKPFRATGKYPVPLEPEVDPQWYRDLIARGEGQSWTKADADALSAKVRRLRDG